MNSELITTAFAQTPEQVTRGNAPIWPMLLAIFAIFYFFIIRPQQKKQKDVRNMINNIEKGDRVVTIGGIFGTVLNVRQKKDAQNDDDVIVLRVADNTKVEMIRSGIGRVLSRETAEAGAKGKQSR